MGFALRFRTATLTPDPGHPGTEASSPPLMLGPGAKSQSETVDAKAVRVWEWEGGRPA